MREPLLVANGQGFWGDSILGPVRLVREGPIHYLALDYLAEVTMSIMQKLKLRDPSKGYATDFVAMLDEGATGEVAQLAALQLPDNLPAMKAIGVRQILRWQAGEISRDEAVELATIATRQYAKRQRTWFRKQMGDWNWRQS